MNLPSDLWTFFLPSCFAVTEEPPSEWRLNLTRVDVIVLGVCCALLLFLLILSIIVCIIYKRKTINKYMHKKHHHVNHHHHHHTSSDASTSQSEDERPIWTAQNGYDVHILSIYTRLPQCFV